MGLNAHECVALARGFRVCVCTLLFDAGLSHEIA